MQSIPLRGKKYVCRLCSSQETVDYEGGLVETPVINEEREQLLLQQEEFGNTGYVHELDAICEACFDQLVQEDAGLAEQLQLAEEESDNLLSLQRARELLDRELWERIADDLEQDILAADLDAFARVAPRAFRELVSESREPPAKRAQDYWQGLDPSRLLEGWLTTMRMEHAGAYMLWKTGRSALDSAMHSCLARLGEAPLALPMDLQAADVFDPESGACRHPRADQKPGRFILLVQARHWAQQQLDAAAAESLESRALEQVQRLWCGRLEELLCA